MWPFPNLFDLGNFFPFRGYIFGLQNMRNVAMYIMCALHDLLSDHNANYNT